MPNILQAELVIKGSDKTAAAFQGVIAHARELQGVLGRMGGMGINDAKMKQALQDARHLTSILRTQNSAWSAINSSIAHGNRYLAERAAMVTRVGERMKTAVANSAYWLGPGITFGAMTAAKSAAAIQSERVRLRAAGIPDTEIAATERQALGLHSRFPNVGVADILERYKELRSVLLHPGEAPEMLPALIQAAAALKAIDKTGDQASSLIFAVKAAEVMGLAQDPARFKNYLDAFLKAQQVMGKTITAEQQFDLAANFKASAATLSDRFKTTTGISLAQELRGMRAGVGVDQFIKQIVGGFQGSQHAAAKEFVALGLAKKSDFETTKTGDIKGFKPGHHVKGSALAASDPDLWVYQYLLPALVKHGFKDQQSQISEVRRLFTSSRSADIVAKLIQQQKSFENHAKLYAAASGLDATDKNVRDPFYAFGEMNESLKTFLGIAASPYMETASLALHNLSQHLAHATEWLSGWQKRHPQFAEIFAGGGLASAAIGGPILTWGLLRGIFGGSIALRGSAAALTGSAGALNAAAARLAGGSVVGNAAAATTGAVTSGTAIAGIGATLWRGGAIAGAVGLLQMMNRDSETGHPLRSWLRSTLGIEDPHEPAPWQPGGQFHPLYDELKPENARRFRIEDIQSLYGDKKAELTGSAEIKQTLIIQPAPDFWTRIKTEISNAISGIVISGNAPAGGTTGPTGSSMPEAAPHAGR